MSATIIDGRAIAATLKQRAADTVRQMRTDGHDVRLDAIMVGDPSAGAIYARSQQTRCEEVGIAYRLHNLSAHGTAADIIDCIRSLNDDPRVTGIVLNLPLPDGIDTPAVQYHIDPYKDVEGVNPANIGLLFYDNPIIAPCTAVAVMEILRRIGCAPRGMDAVVVGQGAIAGRPVSLFLQHQFATVTACHKETRDLVRHTRQADLLVVAVGRPRLIGREHVKPGAVVIDVGINRVTDSSGNAAIVGDVAFDEVVPVASAITPVPGGVGPVTVAVLLHSAAEAARKQLGPRRIPS
ncbi:MAG: bifunctional 5,10-methylenetetrahydrofolate dehydrogenase/5,10-methenyltetrahydrofolate cyclohydrolase [Phycisphaerales bacterium]|nr:bifunctional 5,10-methylenetetrahydrofolate dehydrogenase/5,10-methenyltetrahydrofolate cyclohydrolase [Phycisphaerales bacterium]